jgi:hypothetical protein
VQCLVGKKTSQKIILNSFYFGKSVSEQTKHINLKPRKMKITKYVRKGEKKYLKMKTRPSKLSVDQEIVLFVTSDNQSK